MAALIIGMLVTESLTEAVELTELVMHLKKENKPGETFAQALRRPPEFARGGSESARDFGLTRRGRSQGHNSLP